MLLLRAMIQERKLAHSAIKASKGSIPYSGAKDSDEHRSLDVFFELEIIPRQ